MAWHLRSIFDNSWLCGENCPELFNEPKFLPFHSNICRSTVQYTYVCNWLHSSSIVTLKVLMSFYRLNNPHTHTHRIAFRYCWHTPNTIFIRFQFKLILFSFHALQKKYLVFVSVDFSIDWNLFLWKQSAQ